MNNDIPEQNPVFVFPPLGRRRFLQAVGTGIVVAILEPGAVQPADRLPSAYLRIAEDGTITLYSAKIEMGQGIMTSLAQMAAVELDVPLSVMRVEMGDTATRPADPDGGTWGSITTRGAFGTAMRSASARARESRREFGYACASWRVNTLTTQILQSGGIVSLRGAGFRGRAS